MERLAKADRAEAKASKKKARIHEGSDDSEVSGEIEDELLSNSSRGGSSEAGSDETLQIPQHETVTRDSAAAELEKANRTVFLGNVSTAAIKSKTARRDLLKHLTSVLPGGPSDDKSRQIKSFRFRSTAFTTSAMPKKAAFAKRELMDATTQSTNAYAVYSTASDAREAVKRLNGTMVLERHLRVDGVAHPAPIDHRRCVFVGNLGFVDDDSLIKAAEDPDPDTPKRKKKPKPPSDVEEGLWRQFKTAGEVESVRVVRDQSTRVGKGFAYVQFKVRVTELPPRLPRVYGFQDPNSVERALLFNDKKFPPLLPRKIRVTRAKKLSKTALRSEKNAKAAKADSKAGPTPGDSSMSGRAMKLLGRAGAAQARGRRPMALNTRRVKKPENFVFEGHRAKAGGDAPSLKPGRSRKKGKGSIPKGRATKRSRDFKAGKVAKKRT